VGVNEQAWTWKPKAQDKSDNRITILMILKLKTELI